ncbi:MAG: GNAT family N-acetyltransferase [Candidatus Cloacimonetes bacterium]|nr:GNAT family N-acetyltransferase [Candidatus Cloacimonadota bacterium]
MSIMILQTKRIFVRKATLHDVDFYLTLWNSDKVMKLVGYPTGLGISKNKVEKIISEQNESVFDKTLVVIDKNSDTRIGECKLGSPNADKISTIDIKLLPEYWGKGYGKEIVSALYQYLFSKTDCIIISVTPNLLNIASQRIHKSLGGEDVGRGTYHFPANQKSHTEDVNFIEFHIKKNDWLNKQLCIKRIKEPLVKSDICTKIILNLPAWFGIAESNEAMDKAVRETDFYAAFFNEIPVGFYSVVSHFPQTSEIYVCGILENYQRLGIGSALQRKIEEDLRNKDVSYLTVKTLSSAHPDKSYSKTRKFYQDQGFLPVEEFKDIWGKENPCLMLIKNIQE